MDENENENQPINTGLTVPKIVIITLLIIVLIILCIIAYIIKNQNQPYILSSLDDSESVDMYDEQERYAKASDVGDNVYSSETRTFTHSQENTSHYDSEYEERRIIEEFNNNLKNNIVLSNIIPNVKESGNLYYEITNNNNQPVSNFKIGVAFYNAENKLIDISDIEVEYIPANSVAYVDDYNHQERFTRYDYIVKKEDAYRVFTEDKNSIQYNISEDEDGYIVKIKNIKNDKDSNSIFYAKYYNDEGKLVSIDSEIEYFFKDDRSFYKNSSNESEIYFDKELYNYETGQYIPYSRCEISYFTTYYDESMY